MRGSIRFIAGASLAALCACTVENNASLAILFNARAEGAECTVTATTDEGFSSGVLDVSLGAGYAMLPIIENRMRETTETRSPTTGTEVQETAERNNILIRGFEVELELVDCGEGEQDCLAVAEVVTQNFFEPATVNIGPGARGVVSALAIPNRIASELTARGLLGLQQFTARATMRAVGGRNADEEIKSGDFVYYITLCDGCLTRGFEPQKPCPGGEEEGYCGRPQDAVLDCCWSSGFPYCPASGAPAN